MLESVIRHFAADGLADQSLRRIAEAVGTSHRMLLYHFGSKDGLLLEVAREVEARTEDRLADHRTGAPPPSTDDLVRRMWSYCPTRRSATSSACSSALRARAPGRRVDRPLLQDDLEHLARRQRDAVGTAGVPEDMARAHARLGLAVTRGLLPTCSPPAILPAPTRPSRPSPGSYAGRWWEAQDETRRPATAPRRGRGGPAHRETRPRCPPRSPAPVGDAVAWKP